MDRYYFDLRDDNGITVDDEGMELSGLERVREEAARSLADMARDAIISEDGKTPGELAIDIRDKKGPLFHVKLTFEISKARRH